MSESGVHSIVNTSCGKSLVVEGREPRCNFSGVTRGGRLTNCGRRFSPRFWSSLGGLGAKLA